MYSVAFVVVYHPVHEKSTHESRGRICDFKKKHTRKSVFTFMDLIQPSDRLSQNYRGEGVLNFSKHFPRTENKVA